jgi:hypothetical protein
MHPLDGKVRSVKRFTGTAVAVLLAVVYAGYRSVFTGGWHNSGDGSYACPSSPWHTFRHPLPPMLWGEMLRGIPEACNRDARFVVMLWGGTAVAVVLAVAVTTIVALLVGRGDRTPTID